MSGFVSTLKRVTPRRPLPQSLSAIPLTNLERRSTHMLTSLLLDYPSAQWFERLDTLRAHAQELPVEIAEELLAFIGAAEASDPLVWQRKYVETFDLKRKCSLYLSYFATGDTRRRGTALVTFIEAYRAVGWELDANELPDYLPTVLEFSARSASDVADALLAAHIEGVEVLRAALEAMKSPWAHLVKAVTLSLPPVDAATRERVLTLVNEGPPTETVGLSFLGNLPPFTARSEA